MSEGFLWKRTVISREMGSMATWLRLTALSLAALCSEGVLNAEEEDDLDTQCSNSDAASLVLQKVQQCLCLACKLSTIDY